jgi:hypothetical protein
MTNVEARVVIALFLRREAKYNEAIQVVRGLKSSYPHGYLFCLEEANLRKDAARAWRLWRPTRRLSPIAPGPAILLRRSWS